MIFFFWPKPALCSQPLTLSVGQMVFCCRSVLLNQLKQSSSQAQAEGDDDASRDTRCSDAGTAVKGVGAGTTTPNPAPGMNRLPRHVQYHRGRISPKDSNSQDKEGSSSPPGAPALDASN